ncbi:MAG: YncE family protein [Candidimonas sp.]
MKQAKTMRRMSMLLLVAALAACTTPKNSQDRVSTDSATQSTARSDAVVRQSIGTGLYEVAYSARQNAVFVASAGKFGPESDGSRIYRLNPQTLAMEAEIALPHRGFGVVLDDASDRLYVGHSADAAVTVIDTRNQSIVKTIPLAEKQKSPDGKEHYPHKFRELVVDRAAKRLYLPGMSRDGSSLYVVNTDTLTLETVVAGFGPLATGITLDEQGRRLFVSNLRGRIHQVDTNTLTIVSQWESGSDQPLNLAYDARRGLVYAVDQSLDQIYKSRQKLEPGFTPRAQANDIVVIDPALRKAVAHMPTGQGPVSLLADVERDRLYVTNRGAGSVTVFDLQTRRLLQTVELGSHPNSLALDPASGAVFVSIKRPFVKDGTVVDDVARIELP